MKKTLVLATLAALLALPASAVAKRYNLQLSYGQDVQVAAYGGVSIHVQCIQNDGGFDIVRFYAKTANNAAMRGADNYFGNPFFLTPATPAVNSRVASFTIGTGLEAATNNIDSGFVLNLTTMKGFAYRNEMTMLGVNIGSIDCLVGIDLEKITKFKDPS